MPVIVALALMLAACGDVGLGRSNDQRPTPTPASTVTPAGELLSIDGKPIRQIFIPNPGQAPLYALTDDALFVLEGTTWKPTGTANDERELLVDSLQPEHLFRGDHPPCQLDGADADIMLEVSHDGGASWLPLPQGKNIRPLAVDPERPEVVYGSFCWLAISSTAGHTWMRLNLMERYPLAAIAITGRRVLVLGISPEGRSRLREVDVSDPERPVLGDILLEVPGRACLDVSGNRIVVGAAEGVYISDDGGSTWAISRIGLESVTTTAPIQPTRRTGQGEVTPIGITAIALAPTNSQRIFAGTAHGLYISQDSGATWVRYTEVSLDALVTDIQFAAADLYITTGDGVVAVPRP